MKCKRCGQEVEVGQYNRFCCKCGFPLDVPARQLKVEDLQSFMIDVKSGVMLVNGHAVTNNVLAFDLRFEDGKYSLCVTSDDWFKADAP